MASQSALCFTSWLQKRWKSRALLGADDAIEGDEGLEVDEELPVSHRTSRLAANGFLLCWGHDTGDDNDQSSLASGLTQAQALIGRRKLNDSMQRAS